MKLLVRNLARTTTEAEVRALFEAHGEVEYCTLVLDAETGLSKGFGFVEMPQDAQATAAIGQLNGQHIAKSRIRVKRAE
jgi:RNA recognition motif-containing protein